MKRLIFNWKNYLTNGQAEKMARLLAKQKTSKQMVVCPETLVLPQLSRILKKSKVKIGAQYMAPQAKGAFTGQASIDNLKKSGAKYVLIGHSEHHKYFQETYAMINQKIKLALSKGLVPIFCLGETAQEHKQGKVEKVILRELAKGLEKVDLKSKIIVAYEPIWAIGTGKNCKISQAEQAGQIIWQFLQKKYKSKSKMVDLVYGGSVQLANIEQYFSSELFQGVLIGKASANPQSLVEIINKV